MRKSGCKAHKHLPPVQAPKAFLVILSPASENTSQQPGFYYPGPIFKTVSLKEMHSHVHNTRLLASGLETKKQENIMTVFVILSAVFRHRYLSLKHSPCILPVHFYLRCNGKSYGGWGGDRSCGRKPVQTHWARKKGVSVVKVQFNVLPCRMLSEFLPRPCCDWLDTADAV